MDLNKYLKSGGDTPKEEEGRLSKEEYAAQKKQEREELWAEVDAKAQDIFKDGESLKGFLDFMAQCRPQKTANLLLLYSQNPEIRQVKTFEKWKEEGRAIKSGVHGYRFIASQEYEKDGVKEQGYTIRRVYDIAQVRMKQPEPAEPKAMNELMAALLTDNKINVQVADNLPENVQAQYIPKQRTVYVRNGMDDTVTFHAINRELACADLDRHDGSYSRAGVSAQAYCAAYVVAQKYGVDTNGFNFSRVCQQQENGTKDPKELRAVVGDIRTAAYGISGQISRNLGEMQQESPAEEFTIPETKSEKTAETKGNKAKADKVKKQPVR